MSPGSTIRWDNSGDFLNWWFERPRLKAEAFHTFNRYYSNYRKKFDGYIKQTWADRHLELDRELKAIVNRCPVRVMDLGCGTGSIALYCALKLEGKGEVLGVDINEERLFCAKKRMGVLERELGFEINCEFKHENVLSLRDNDKFDLIYLEETLHHMEPRPAVAKKISWLLKDKGILVISESNAYNLFMQFNLLRKRGLHTIRTETSKDGKISLYAVERIMPPKVVAKLFGDNSLTMKSLRYFRMASTRLGNLADRKGIDLIKLERRLSNIDLLSKIFSIHYNIVFEK